MSVADPTAELPTSWSRLSPASPVVRAGREVMVVLGIAGANSVNHGEPPWVPLGVAVIASIAGFVYWRVTRWRIHSGELQIDTGLVRRQQIRVPLTQIQGIDLVRPLLARMFGVSEIRVVLAGQGSAPARLSYLAEERAVAVRAQLLALAHGLAPDVPEPLERPIIGVPPSRIVAAGLASPPAVLGILFVAVAITVGVVVPSAIGPALGSFVALFIMTIGTTWAKVAAEWDFRVAEAPDGLRLQSGLLQHRAETVPYGRIQAVRWIEPLCWRPFGWVRLEFDVARRTRAARRGPADRRDDACPASGRIPRASAVAAQPRAAGSDRRTAFIARCPAPRVPPHSARAALRAAAVRCGVLVLQHWAPPTSGRHRAARKDPEHAVGAGSVVQEARPCKHLLRYGRAPIHGTCGVP